MCSGVYSPPLGYTRLFSPSTLMGNFPFFSIAIPFWIGEDLEGFRFTQDST